MTIHGLLGDSTTENPLGQFLIGLCQTFGEAQTCDAVIVAACRKYDNPVHPPTGEKLWERISDIPGNAVSKVGQVIGELPWLRASHVADTHERGECCRQFVGG
ncbi:MAG: hypothetical protein WCX71_05590 [Candidatus Buchananbacteria bacterium]